MSIASTSSICAIALAISVAFGEIKSARRTPRTIRHRAVRYLVRARTAATL